MPETLVLVFAKEPRPGQVKTRLCPPLTPDQAARCQRAFLEDLLLRLATFLTGSPAESVDLQLVASPDGDSPWLQELAAGRRLALRWQGEGDLGQRMERAMRRHCRAGRCVVIVGSDSPDLPMSHLGLALDAVRRGATVLGPSHDGGYYLVGNGGPVPPIFALSCAWGSEQVLEETLARLVAARHSYELLPAWPDVDEFDGLRGLAARLAGESSTIGRRDQAVTSDCHATRRLLGELRAEGVAL